MPKNSTPLPRADAPDPRSPFVFDTRELGRRPGVQREYQRPATAPDGLSLELIGVPVGAPIALDVQLQSVTEGVLVTGMVTTMMRGECGRCLEPVDGELAVELCELFAHANSTTDETTEQDEVHRLEHDLLDLEPVVRDAVVIALPWTPLCRPDCAGLCPTCGVRLDDLGDAATHSHDQIDPRWAALAGRAQTEDAPDAGRAAQPAERADETRPNAVSQHRAER